MLDLRKIGRDILASGGLDSAKLEVLHRQLYADGAIDRRKADFLVEMHQRVQYLTPAFEQFFFQAIKEYILADSWIDAEQAAWLRRMLYEDGKIHDEERKFLRELKGEAKHVSREFEALFEQCMRQPMEQRTCG